MEKQVRVVRLSLPGERDVQRVLNRKVTAMRIPPWILWVALSVALWIPPPPAALMVPWT